MRLITTIFITIIVACTLNACAQTFKQKPIVQPFDSAPLILKINEKVSQAALKDSLIAVRSDFPKPVDLQYLKRDIDLKATITSLRDSLLTVRSLINNSGNIVNNVTVNNDLASLSTVNDLQNYKGNSASLIIADDVRGGLFNLYTGADEADNGMIFLDALNRKWKRFTTGDKIYVKWYGVIPYTNYDKETSTCKVVLTDKEINYAIKLMAKANDKEAAFRYLTQMIDLNCYNTMQLKELLETASIDMDRLNIAKKAYSHVTDQQNINTILTTFRYPAMKESFASFLKEEQNNKSLNLLIKEYLELDVYR